MVDSWPDLYEKWRKTKQRFIALIILGFGGFSITKILEFFGFDEKITDAIDTILIVICICLILIGFFCLVVFYLIKENRRKKIFGLDC